MTKRKQRSDSEAGQKKQSADMDTVMPVPDGVQFTTDEEMVLWRQFTSARSKDMWREFDLLLIAKMVVLEINLRKHNAALEAAGPIIENGRGTMVENPLLRVIDTLQREQLSVIRSLSLGVSSQAAQDMNKSGVSASEKKDVEKLKKGSVTSLLAI